MPSSASPHPVNPLRVVLVDDEELARDRLQSLLEQQPDVLVVGACADGPTAIETIERERPDLIFLDVQMPGMDGFDVVAHLDRRVMPAVIFVTAYDGHALRAFEVHALDFLLKPFDQARFETALDRARLQLRGSSAATLDKRILSLLETLEQERHHVDRFIVKSGGRVFFLRTEDVDWVEAAGNYVKVHSGGDSHLLRESMKNMEGRLDPKRFVRIHRSAIVNIDSIKQLEPWFHGEYVVMLRDGTKLTASRVFSDRLTALIP